MSGPGGKLPPSYVTFTQKYDPQYWQNWDSGLITSGDASAIGHEIVSRLESAGAEVRGAWFVTHDQDKQADGSVKDPHIHGVIQQSAGRRVAGKLHPREIDDALGFSSSVARAPRQGARIENAQSYLIHAKDKDKFQYAVSDVSTVRGRDYAEIEQEFRDAWARRRMMGRKTSVSQKEWYALGDALVQQVLDGEVDELTILKDKTLMDIYTRNEARVNLALKNAARREMLAEVEKLRAGEFKKTIIWVMGESQTGKTWLLRGLQEKLQNLLGWSAYAGAARNAADKYRGEHMFVLNEPGKAAFEWPDLLTLLGPYEAGPLSARYSNLDAVAPRMVAVGVAVDPVNFGFFVPGKRSTGDSLDQLLLRLSLVVTSYLVDGESRYDVARVVSGSQYLHYVAMPGDSARDGRAAGEHLPLTARPEMLYSGLDRNQTIDVILSELGKRSPDVLGVDFGSLNVPLIEAKKLALQIEDERRANPDKLLWTVCGSGLSVD